jgi:hypothetical protein
MEKISQAGIDLFHDMGTFRIEWQLDYLKEGKKHIYFEHLGDEKNIIYNSNGKYLHLKAIIPAISLKICNIVASKTACKDCIYYTAGGCRV